MSHKLFASMFEALVELNREHTSTLTTFFKLSIRMGREGDLIVSMAWLLLIHWDFPAELQFSEQKCIVDITGK